MNVSLSPELERQIAEKVDAGLYSSASEVVRDALHRLFEAEELRIGQLAWLNADIQLGIEQADRGEVIDGETSRRHVTSRFTRQRG